MSISGKDSALYVSLVNISVNKNKKIKNEVKFEESKENEIKFHVDDLCFFWKANANPFDLKEQAIWAPFERGEQIFLEQEYQKFLKGSKSSTNLNDYRYDFKNWLQISTKDPSKQRPIRRDFSKNVANVIRKNRIDMNLELDTQAKVIIKTGWGNGTKI